jgi:hypothetical protein
MDTMLSSEFGSRLLAKCFEKTRGGEDHCALEEAVLGRASEIAKGRYRYHESTTRYVHPFPPNSS